MDEQKIRSIVRQEIQSSASGGRFGLNPIQRHTHNNVDSPYVFQPTFIYAGYVGSDGSVLLLPNGWTSSFDGSHTYTVTHNIGSIYIVNASPIQSTNHVCSPVIEPFSNSFDVSWFDVNGSGTTTGFGFILTVINNKSMSNPIYVGTATL